MTKYSTLCDVGFIVVHEHDNPYNITVEELIQALENRIKDLKEQTNDAIDAFGILDTYELGV